ncbi:MAG: protein-L-isoaspartate O-methyltransferase [Alysiella sp.]|uniref:protein-L-isoaspartate O-methyltransferase family protein n=1 Tax=Alysiella sp. TaxID=1872483 RepID=UPI0026DC0028|nr:protein-L-isoaspartate O-methyltransferase [Alysiella sp.]MDO4434203.1 protein-L-isoaspartate O-methyltransferase [Alysiella sp.]
MDFNQARFNMVEQQIRPWDVLDFDLLDALAEIPREHFVAPEQKNYAYADLALALPNGSMMLEPKIVARMIQGLKLQKTDHILEVGTGSGYATAVLSLLSANVLTFDTDETQLAAAKKALNELNYHNIRFEHGDGLAFSGSQQFDAIYIGGSLPVFPENLKEKLNPQGGRMVVVVGTAPIQRCLQIVRNGDIFNEKTLFDTQIAALNTQTLTKPNTFTF